MSAKSIEIVCPACRRDTILRREPKYDGFRKVGESLFCASCKHEFADEESVPFKEKRAAKVFDEADRTPVPELFHAGEELRTCRHCRHYVVNPFLQRCGLHKRLVEATDSCRDFDRKETPPAEGGTPPTAPE